MQDRIINISIRIADLPRIPLRIPQREEEIVRRAEANINSLWEKWSDMEEFREKTSAQVLAMVTFRFAQMYYSNLEGAEKLDATLQGLEGDLDNLLLNDIAAPAAE